MSQLLLEPKYVVQYFQCNAGAAACQPKAEKEKETEIKTTEGGPGQSD